MKKTTLNLLYESFPKGSRFGVISKETVKTEIGLVHRRVVTTDSMQYAQSLAKRIKGHLIVSL